MHVLIMAATIVVCATAAYADLRTRRIPNALSAAIVVLGLLRVGCAQDLVAGAATLAAAGAAFAVTFALFRYGAIGGGDAKMITATTLLVGYQQVVDFLFLMSLCGGALALATLAAEKCDFALRRPPAPAGAPMQHGKRQRMHQRLTVPYGVAVAAGGTISLIVSG